MARRRDLYVTGFDGNGEVIYGGNSDEGESEFCNPMTLQQAREELRHFAEANDPSEVVAIYRLTLVEKTTVGKIRDGAERR